MKNINKTKELIIKETGCDKVMKKGDKYIIYFKRKDINFYDYEIISKQEMREIYLKELGI